MGIYGDSFATGSLPKNPDGSYDSGIEYHWSTLIANELNYIPINYGISGSALYNSYESFLKTHHNQEFNIVVLTFPFRCHVKSNIIQNTDFFCSLNHLEEMEKKYSTTINADDRKIIDMYRNWYMLQALDRSHYYTDMARLMINHIKELKPNTLFVRTNPYITETENIDFTKIYLQQIDMLGINPEKDTLIENTKLIAGHMTPDFNKLIADYILVKIKTGNWPEWKIPEDFKFKFTKKEYFKVG